MDITSNGQIQPGQINVKEIVQEFMLKEQRPLQKLQQDDKSDKTQVNAYIELQNLLSNFRNTIQDLTPALSPAYTVSSSNVNIATATATGTTVLPITHTLTVQTLAQAESIASKALDSTAALGVTDTIGMAVGSSNFNINVDASDTINSIAQKINNGASASGVGVLASVVAVAGGSSQLVISSTQTGLANKVNITESSGAPLDLTHELTAASNATFTFDTLNMSEATNTINDAATGLSINLLSTTTVGQSVNIIVNSANPTADSVQTAVQSTLDAYNQIIGFIDQAQVDPSIHNELFNYVKTTLQNTMTAALPSGTFKTLDSLGIVMSQAKKLTTTITYVDQNGEEKQRAVDYSTIGELQISTDQYTTSFAANVSNNFAAVQSLLLNASNGIFTAVSKQINPLTGDIPIQIQSNINTTNQAEQKLAQQISDEKDRLKGVEDRLTKQWAEVNVTLQKFKDMSDYLKRQIDSIASISFGDSNK